MKEIPVWLQGSLPIRLAERFRSFSCRGILINPALAAIPASKQTYITARIIKNWSPLLRRFLTVIC